MKKLFIVCIVALLPGMFVNAQGNQQTAIKQTALDYADGFYSGNAERLERALHPDFNKVVAYKLQQTGKTFLDYSTISGLVEYTKTNEGFLEEDKRRIKLVVLSENENVATIKLTSAFFNDFLQLVNFDGQWKIVNVLWSAGPDTPNLPPPVELDSEKEKETVEAAINEYYTGVFTGDVDKLQKVIHPEVSIAQLKNIKQTGKHAINRNGAGFLVELSRAGFLKVPEDQRELNIEILDLMDEMAVVRATTSKATSFFQLQRIDGQWKIINLLSVSKSEIK